MEHLPRVPGDGNRYATELNVSSQNHYFTRINAVA